MPPYVKKTNNPRMGRPKKHVDWDLAEKLCVIHCTEVEIASTLGISIDTLERALRDKFGQTFAEYFNIHSARGKCSLRRKQYLKAMQGNTGLLVWLGKQWLDQRDEPEPTHANVPKFQIEILSKEDSRPPVSITALPDDPDKKP